MQTDNALTHQQAALQFQLVERFNQVVICSSLHRLQHVFLVILLRHANFSGGAG
jgi:hypothetical protein